jgi:membrane-associated protease RseP (regulator of RpoE activity)
MVAVELLGGHPLSARLRERAQFIGFSLLMLLILFVTYNDILQLMT